jgi:hypothetical protein
MLRHSAAMELFHAGVDCSVIALWLGMIGQDDARPEATVRPSPASNAHGIAAAAVAALGLGAAPVLVADQRSNSG